MRRAWRRAGEAAAWARAALEVVAGAPARLVEVPVQPGDLVRKLVEDEEVRLWIGSVRPAAPEAIPPRALDGARGSFPCH